MAITPQDAKGLLKEFSGAPWKQKEQMDSFINRVAACGNFPIKKAFTMMHNNGHIADPVEFKKKLYCFEVIAASHTDASVANYFLDEIDDVPKSLREAVARILLKFKDPSWHQKAVKLLAHKDIQIRLLAKDLCANTGGKTLFEHLSQGLRNRSIPAGPESLEVIVKVAGHHALPVLKDIYKPVAKREKIAIINLIGNVHYMKSARKDASTFLVEILADKDPLIVKNAIRNLGNVGNQEHLPVLLELAQRQDAPFLEDLIQAVGKLGGDNNTEVINLLTVVIRSGRPNLQMAAIEGLYNIGKNEVLAPLSISLHDKNIQVRQRGADAFIKLAKERKVDIGRLLIFLMKERDPNVRRIAIEIIDTVGKSITGLWKNLIGYLKDADWWVRERVTDVLINIGGEEIIQPIVALLDDDREIVRRYAIEVLVRLEHKAALPYLVERAQLDSDWWVRERAIEAIGTLGTSEHVPALLKLLENDELRWITVRSLSNIKDPRTIPYLLPYIKVGEPEFRIDVLNALQATGDRSIVEPIKELQNDINKEVRKKAIEILQSHQIAVMSEDEFYKKSQNLTLLDRLLLQTKKKGGTDLFLHSGCKPYIRYLSDVICISEQELDDKQVTQFVKSIMPEDKWDELKTRGDTDFSYQIRGENHRFRVNIYKQRQGLSAVFRVINNEVTPIEELNFSEHVIDLLSHHQGMILVTGPAGSGKTTTLMAMIDHMNRHRYGHIITLEDPVEYIVENNNCLVNQREVGRSTASFQSGLRAALREDPDVVLVGEMRDAQTFSIAITAAETGHLVLGTLHTLGAAQTVDRLIDAFPAEQQPQIRSMVSESLKGVITQQLVKKKSGDGRVLVTEVMIMNDAISNMIRKHKTYQIPSVLATGVEQGMHQLDLELKNLVEKGAIAYEEALVKCVNKKEFEKHFAKESKEVDQSGGNHTEAAKPEGE